MSELADKIRRIVRRENPIRVVIVCMAVQDMAIPFTRSQIDQCAICHREIWVTEWLIAKLSISPVFGLFVCLDCAIQKVIAQDKTFLETETISGT